MAKLDKEARQRRNIRALGVLYILGSCVLLVLPALVLSDQELHTPGYMGLSLVFVGLSALYFCVAIGLMMHRNWARIIAIGLAGIGLLGFPIGTIISVVILYVLFDAKPLFVRVPPS
jgi:hypothetical protein